MMLDYINKNQILLISFAWLIFLIIYVIFLYRKTTKTIKSEKKLLFSLILLFIGSIVVILYNTDFGIQIHEKLIKNVGKENLWTTFILIIFLLLYIKIFTLKLKIQKLNSKIKKIDQRFSLNENHNEYKQRKNIHRNYRSK